MVLFVYSILCNLHGQVVHKRGYCYCQLHFTDWKHLLYCMVQRCIWKPNSLLTLTSCKAQIRIHDFHQVGPCVRSRTDFGHELPKPWNELYTSNVFGIVLEYYNGRVVDMESMYSLKPLCRFLWSCSVIRILVYHYAVQIVKLKVHIARLRGYQLSLFLSRSLSRQQGPLISPFVRLYISLSVTLS